MPNESSFATPDLESGDFTVITPCCQAVRDLLRTEVHDTSANDAEPKGATVPKSKKKAEAKSLPVQASIREETGRILACSCFAGKAMSLTVRWSPTKSPFPKYPPKAQWRKSGYQANTGISPEFYSSIQDVCGILFSEITNRAPTSRGDDFDTSKFVDNLGYRTEQKEKRFTGLVLVTGSTNSSKSQIARGLVDMFLYEEWLEFKGEGKGRKPHLVTYEDPIEEYWLPFRDLCLAGHLDNYPGWFSNADGPDYTPRERAVDVANLKDAVNDALRQTPAVMYIGEVRNATDWEHVLKLAGTGHLVVATSHAGSITEALSIMIRQLNISTPAGRSELIDKIRAVTHLRAHSLKGQRVVVPALWRRTNQGLKDFVSDGLASILPNCFEIVSNSSKASEVSYDQIASLGRRHFAKRLKALWVPPTADKQATADLERIRKFTPQTVENYQTNCTAENWKQIGEALVKRPIPPESQVDSLLRRLRGAGADEIESLIKDLHNDAKAVVGDADKKAESDLTTWKNAVKEWRRGEPQKPSPGGRDASPPKAPQEIVTGADNVRPAGAAEIPDALERVALYWDLKGE